MRLDVGRLIKMTYVDNNLYSFFWGKRFKFNNEILSRYYLSLKTKPFTILTGISGTGKTKIAQLFAEYMCQKESEEDTKKERKKRIAFIPVRPDWMDNRGLLGYYNVLQEHYVKTPLLALLLEAKKNQDKPHFVILDEMNLAKVEYYFSDFLSIMESRTPDNPEGESISLYDKNQLSEGKTLDVPPEIKIPNNVFFTGTVNIDESTYMFSPKVLDRANVIEFNEVILDASLQGKSNAIDESFNLLEHDVLEQLLNLNGESELTFFTMKDNKDLNDCSVAIIDLLKLLEPTNMHFGYRVANEMARFIILASERIDQFEWQEALDIQILQKILPKLHGTRAKLENPIQVIIEYCDERGFIRSKHKLLKMNENLQNSGYASFIE